MFYMESVLFSFFSTESIISPSGTIPENFLKLFPFGLSCFNIFSTSSKVLNVLLGVESLLMPSIT